MTWPAIVVLGLGCYLLKAVGPLSHGRFSPSPRVERALSLIPPALLSALVATGIVARDTALQLDERLLGIAAAAVAIVLRVPLAGVIFIAAGVTAGVRTFI
jgi:branched-subunit amino acid transport protein